MARASSGAEQGVPSFTYSPAADTRQQLLFEFNRPLNDLKSMLMKDFAGQTLAMREIYERHSVGRPYVKKNYKDVLEQLEKESAIRAEGRKVARGFAEHIIVTFPARSR